MGARWALVGLLLLGASIGCDDGVEPVAGWSSAGGSPHGRFSSLVIARTAPATIYVAGDGGLFRSVSGSGVWSRFDAGLPQLRPGDGPLLAVDPVDPTQLALALGRVGLFVSERGQPWGAAGAGLEGMELQQLTAGPTRGELYVVADARLLRSRDHGRSFGPVAIGPEEPPVAAFAIDPTTPARRYAATRRALFESRDGGASWRPTSGALPSDVYIITAISVGAGGAVYLASGASVIASADGGASWRATSLREGVQRLLADPVIPGLAYATTWLDVQRTSDGGASWRRLDLGPALSPDLVAVDPGGAVLYAAGIGVGLSADRGLTWTALPSGLPPLRLSAAVVGPWDGRAVVVAAERHLRYSADGGVTWGEAQGAISPRGVASLAADPHHPGVLYAGERGGANGAGGRLLRSTDGGRRWSAVPTFPTCLSGCPAAHTVTSLLVDPNAPGTLYAATEGDLGPTLAGAVLASTDGGASWSSQSAGLSGAGPVSLAIAPGSPSLLYAASPPLDTGRAPIGGGLFRWRRGDAIWSRTALTPGIVVAESQLVAPSRQVALLTSRRSIHRTTDGGATWANVPSLSLPAALAAAPSDPRVVYASAAEGLHRSRDGGATFDPAGVGLERFSPRFGWTLSTLPHLFAIDPGDPLHVYAAGPEGDLLETETGGR